ncbi:MAG: hypothetical protein IKB15_04315 [Alistipes sp.]|nr:hypothetical protein [Alistipes sp.]
MKRLILLAAIAVGITSCGTLKNSATHRDFNVNTPYAVPIIADLEVSDTKIKHVYIPTKDVKNGGTDNVINTAVREALTLNGNADVLVGLETQIQFNSSRKVKSIVITGYPAKYKNFRNLDEEEWYNNEYFQSEDRGNKRLMKW